MQVLAFIFSETKDVLSIITFLLIIPLGVISIQMGLSLLKLKDSLHGLRNVYSYILIFMGVSLVSIILIIPGLLLGIAADVILGIILLRAASEVRK
jgi:hypothetical protein